MYLSIQEVQNVIWRCGLKYSLTTQLYSDGIVSIRVYSGCTQMEYTYKDIKDIRFERMLKKAIDQEEDDLAKERLENILYVCKKKAIEKVFCKFGVKEGGFGCFVHFFKKANINIDMTDDGYSLNYSGPKEWQWFIIQAPYIYDCLVISFVNLKKFVYDMNNDDDKAALEWIRSVMENYREND